ncbi:MAG: hypothetical protein ACK55Z_12845 [bacterium]
MPAERQLLFHSNGALTFKDLPVGVGDFNLNQVVSGCGDGSE